MRSRRSGSVILFVMLLCSVTAVPSPAQTPDILANFDLATGTQPIGNLVQGLDGNFYGVTDVGGNMQCQPDTGCGTVFKVSPEGKITMLHAFKGSDGASPQAGLILGTDGNFYGTTLQGGAGKACTGGCGTVFRITPAGKLTTLHSFNSTDGAFLWGALVQTDDGNFYGVTEVGGNLKCNPPVGCGTVFKIAPSGEFTTLHDFEVTDGSFPFAGLTQGADGDLYGSAEFGGDLECNIVSSRAESGCGTIFKLTLTGQFATLLKFPYTTASAGYFPWTKMVQAPDGNFFGTTYGNAFSPLGFGTAFTITPEGVLTNLHSFCADENCPDGFYPEELVLATNGEFYGPTRGGGLTQAGVLFKITAEGDFTTLYTFCPLNDLCPDGAGPTGLLQATDGNFYGITAIGGTNTCYEGPNCGTFFRFSAGLGPFVKTLPTSGKAETKIYILGTDLTGASSVTFDGMEAKFTVVSETEITAAVPACATTGKVKVETPRGTLVSNTNFQVTP